MDREKYNAYQREWKRLHRAEITRHKKERRQNDKEYRDRVSENSKRWYQAHKEVIREKTNRNVEHLLAHRRRVIEVKRMVLSYYGNGKVACVKCGFDNMHALSIDHINGREGKGRIVSFYYWLIRNGYPEGYQTLCMNCQWIKRYECNELRRKDIGIEC